MKHPFDALQAEYTLLWSTMDIRDPGAVEETARKLLGLKPRYSPVRTATGVPVVWLAAVDERESGASGRCYFGNGDPLDRPTTDVPRGRGPFADWAAGAIDAIALDQIDKVMGWSVERSLYEGEAWNGWGPRGKGIHTGYLWAGTQHYKTGKYVKDGVWDPAAEDKQIGIAPMMSFMMRLDATILLPMNTIAQAVAQTLPASVPALVGGAPGHDARWIQAALNALGQDPPLVLDGSYGRNTRRAVMDFQAKHGLVVDGLVGPLTLAKLEQGEHP